MYLKPKWILKIYRMQYVRVSPLAMTAHTLTLRYFHFSLYLSDSLSLGFMSLNKTDVNFNCSFKSFYEVYVSLDSLFIKIWKTSWSIEVLLTNYRTTWCWFYYNYKINHVINDHDSFGSCGTVVRGFDSVVGQIDSDRVI